jgi:hypothetical protein
LLGVAELIVHRIALWWFTWVGSRGVASTMAH